MSRIHMVSEYDGRKSGDMPAALCKAETTDSDGRTRLIASTADEDRDRDIVEQNWRLKNYRRNPVILWMHQRLQHPIGRGTELKQGGSGRRGELSMTIEWDMENPVGALTAGQYARKHLHAFSVGFIPETRTLRSRLANDHPAFQRLGEGEPDWMSGWYLDAPELLENSAVTVPANPNAIAVRSWAMEAEGHADQVERALSETVTRATREWLMDAFRHDAELRSVMRAALLSMPEPTPKPDPEPEDKTPADWWARLPAQVVELPTIPPAEGTTQETTP